MEVKCLSMCALWIRNECLFLNWLDFSAIEQQLYVCRQIEWEHIFEVALNDHLTCLLWTVLCCRIFEEKKKLSFWITYFNWKTWHCLCYYRKYHHIHVNDSTYFIRWSCLVYYNFFLAQPKQCTPSIKYRPNARPIRCCTTKNIVGISFHLPDQRKENIKAKEFTTTTKICSKCVTASAILVCDGRSGAVV